MKKSKNTNKLNSYRKPTISYIGSQGNGKLSQYTKDFSGVVEEKVSEVGKDDK